MNITKTHIIYSMLFISLLVFFFCSGGLMVTISEERVDPATVQITLQSLIIASSALLAVACVNRLLRGRWLPATWKGGDDRGTGQITARHLLFSTLLFALLIATSLMLLNLAASFFAVPWPMNGLHGVSSAVGKKAWEFQRQAEGFVKVNSWGQRDREHSLLPQTGVSRMIFIGDSMLEDGAPVPLPYRTEQILNGMGPKTYELINLGVTATDPDEYFFRLKRIGLPLQPKHCVMIFSAGTDFIQEPTLLSYGGISATYPRWSFLQFLGLNSLDQFISNERRQVLRAWFKGGSLLKHELELQDIFGKTLDDGETERAYLSFFPPPEQAQLKSVLDRASAEERGRLFKMLRKPDNGVFRSYYLDIATKVAKGLPAQTFTPAEYSFRWIKAAAELCSKQGVTFTLVVIPDGFSVDTRMSEQYAALADMKAYMRYKDEASNRLVQHAIAEGMQVVDLRRILTNSRGAYLNMDGHLSQDGVDRVAEYLAKNLMESLENTAAGKR